MTDSQTLLLVLVAIYLSECVAWTNLHVVALIVRTNSAWRIRRPGEWFGNNRRGLLIKPVLPPFHSTLLCQFWPISIAPGGILSNTTLAVGRTNRPEQPSEYVSFDEMNQIDSEENWLRINGRRFAHLVSPILARWMVEELRAIKKASREERSPFIEAMLAKSFDDRAIELRLQDLSDCRRSLVPMATLLFAHLFVLSPILVWLRDWTVVWPVVFGGLFLLTMIILVTFLQVHQRLHPEESYFRWTHAFVMMLNPLQAIRANDLLSRDAVVTFHPVAVLRTGEGGEAFRELARQLVIDLRFSLLPLEWSELTEAAAAAEWFRLRHLAAVESTLIAAKVNLEELVRPAEPVDETCCSYCPRCGCQYIAAIETCSPCGGRAVISFSTDNNTKPTSHES